MVQFFLRLDAGIDVVPNSVVASSTEPASLVEEVTSSSLKQPSRSFDEPGELEKMNNDEGTVPTTTFNTCVGHDLLIVHIIHIKAVVVDTDTIKADNETSPIDTLIPVVKPVISITAEGEK
jgi:hypothetical protein